MSDRDSWATPAYIFDPLDHEFSFNIDVCASRDNAKVDTWINEEQDALVSDWTFAYRKSTGLMDRSLTAFCNPPYSDVAPWVDKAIHEARVNNVTTVILTNYILDCAYYRDHLHHIAEIRLALNRIQFEPPPDVLSSSNSKPQMLTIITPNSAKAHGTPLLSLWANGKKPKG